MRATKQLERTREVNEWRLNVGRAVDVLRADNVALFDDPTRAMDFSIFSRDVEMVDARLPGFHLHGLDAYRKLLQSLQWSMSFACESARLEITAMPPPINNNVYMRWRLHLVPRDVLAPAKGFLQPLGTANPLLLSRAAPVTVEGYSRYEFDPWSAEIVKHSVEITNPPMSLTDVLQQYTTGLLWARDPSPVRMPQVASAM